MTFRFSFHSFVGSLLESGKIGSCNFHYLPFKVTDALPRDPSTSRGNRVHRKLPNTYSREINVTVENASNRTRPNGARNIGTAQRITRTVKCKSFLDGYTLDATTRKTRNKFLCNDVYRFNIFIVVGMNFRAVFNCIKNRKKLCKM